MPLIDFKPAGVIKDVSPVDVGDKFYTDALNMRFADGRVVTMQGEVVSFVPTADPLHLQFSGDHTDPFWFYTTDTGIRATDFVNDTDLDIAGTIIPGGEWDSSLFNLIGVFNNTKQAPVFSTGTTQIAPLPGFPADTTVNAIRAFRSFLVALNTTTTGNEQPNRVLWSDQADAGSLPQSWDITDPSTLSGDVFLTETKGEIIDGAQLRDFFVIYKTHSMVLMSFSGGQEVMSFQRSQINIGILTKDCVVEFEGRHFVFTDNDIVLFDGQNVESIANDTVRNLIFNSMDRVNYTNAYVRRSDRHKEIWVCYPETGQVFANKAAVWSWEDNTWTFRDISDARDIASGVTDFIPSPTYDSQAGVTYDSQAGVLYEPSSASPSVDLMVKASSFALVSLDVSAAFQGNPIPTIIEKASMSFGEPERVKLVNKVIPRIVGTTGDVVNIRVGSQYNIEDPIVWAPEVQFVIGTDREVSTLVKGKFISIRFRTDVAGTLYRLNGFQMNVQQAGRH